MDVNEPNIRDVDCRKPQLVHTSESSIHNGHVSSTLNLSYQIVLQDHNYGAPLPLHDSLSYTLQCKQESSDAHMFSAGNISQSQRGSLKTLRNSIISSQSGRVVKPNGVTTLVKRQRTASSNSNGINSVSNVTPPGQVGPRRLGAQGCETAKSHNIVSTPPLVPKSASNFPYAGDLNSHLYASISNDKNTVKEEPKDTTTLNGSSGLSNYFGGWYRGSGGNNVERVRSRSDMRDSFNDDDSNDGSLVNSPRTANDSDHEGEETETAPECEDEEDEQGHIDLLVGGRDLGNVDESVTRCICKFGHDDGYMICCDRCSVWQHVDCMNLDRNNIPDEFLCELCQPRRVDRARARAIQYRKRQEFRLSSPLPSSNPDRGPASRRERSKDRTKNDEFIDVEKTPKKFQRSCATANSGSKYPRGGTKVGNTTIDRADKLQRVGKRPGQLKWKRRSSEKQDASDIAPRKRKMFRSKASDIDVGGPSSTAAEINPTGGRNHPSGELLLQWIDHYEEAVTNHYSPELRARVSAVRPNNTGLSGESLTPPSTSLTYRLASKAGGYKTLVAASPIHFGSPIIECRGKYMLASQLRPYKSGDGAGLSGFNASNLRPTPHIIFHHLVANSTDNTTPVVEMCIDGRSYGNEARFVWQSCQPNAEIKHKVEKGSLHLYLVAKTDILESEEITVAHDAKNPLPCPYEGCPHMKNKDSGARTGLAPTAHPLSTPSPVEAERKRRRRRTNSTANDSLSNPHVIVASNIGQSDSLHTTAPSSSIQAALTPMPSTPPTLSSQPVTPVKRHQRTPSKVTVALTEGEDSHDDTVLPDEIDGHVSGSVDNESLSNKKKLSREERKMEAIMKAFERMEKAQQRRQESIAKTTHRKDSRDGKDELGDEVDQSPSPSDASENPVSNEKRVVLVQEPRTKAFRKGKRGGRMRRASSGAGVAENSRIRMRALSGEVHSGHSATEEELDQVGGDGSSPIQVHSEKPSDDPSTMAFKCPKTKKVVFNNWSGDGIELNGSKGDCNDPLGGSNSLSLAVPVCYMRNPNPRSPTRPFRSAHLRYGATTTSPNQPFTLDLKSPYNMLLNGCRPSTLVSLKSSAGSASPDPHGDGGHSNDENAWTAPLPGSGGAGGSAKKRWLRQAISEETETEPPSSGGLGSGAIIPVSEVLDHVTPLKKRRLARASISSETSFTPPSTPTPGSVSAVGLNEHVSNELGLQPLMEKDESNAESLSGENSQGTLSECDDASAEASQSQRQSDHELNESIDPRIMSVQPTLDLAKAIIDLSSPANGCISKSSQQQWSSRNDEIVLPKNDLNVTSASADDRTNADLALTQIHENDRRFMSSTLPTWEFRAPDAQFMRCRNSSDIPDAVAAIATEDAVCKEKPKPIKRKLSILEYRQRKQITFNDGHDVLSKDEANQEETSPLKAENLVSDRTWSTRTINPPNLSVDDSHSKSTDDSNTNSSFEGEEEPHTSL